MPYRSAINAGRVVRTYLRGTLVAENGRPLDLRSGRFLPGAGAVA
ncbi:hypothetical protein [Nonomuraea aridisoli]|nr:hypothetical protein [Nonomuraea aridisoli]